MQEKNNVGAEATTKNTGATEATVNKKSFDELLQDKEYQSAFDKKIAQSLRTAKAKWQEDLETEKTKAEKLAKMKIEQKLQYQLEKERSEKDNALAELSAYKLKEKAIKIASEKGLDISLLNLIDFKTVTAEKLNEDIDNLSVVFSKAVEKSVNKRLKEEAPIEKTSLFQIQKGTILRYNGIWMICL